MSTAKAAMAFVESVLSRPVAERGRGPGPAWQPVARFQLDDRGCPYFDDVDGVRHFWIGLSLNTPDRERIRWVEYRLHSSFHHRVRFSDEPENDFADVIQTYGDFTVRVIVNIDERKFEEKMKLSALLRAGHAGDTTPEIEAAINRIESN